MPLMIDKTWTLFLDRDGVINERLVDDYVKTPDQFKFIQGSDKAIVLFSEMFHRIVVVTNQQGIGKGLMTHAELDLVHEQLFSELARLGGRIDKIYVSPHLHSARHFTRKPSVGMAIQAKKDFKEISFRRSIMAGDSISDMLFGKRLGMKTVFIGSPDELRDKSRLVDFCFPDLYTFALSLSESNKTKNIK
jgi:histidinol-phosphate phosphatase family protein